MIICINRWGNEFRMIKQFLKGQKTERWYFTVMIPIVVEHQNLKLSSLIFSSVFSFPFLFLFLYSFLMFLQYDLSFLPQSWCFLLFVDQTSCDTRSISQVIDGCQLESLSTSMALGDVTIYRTVYFSFYFQEFSFPNLPQYLCFCPFVSSLINFCFKKPFTVPWLCLCSAFSKAGSVLIQDIKNQTNKSERKRKKQRQKGIKARKKKREREKKGKIFRMTLQVKTVSHFKGFTIDSFKQQTNFKH